MTTAASFMKWGRYVTRSLLALCSLYRTCNAIHHTHSTNFWNRFAPGPEEAGWPRPHSNWLQWWFCHSAPSYLGPSGPAMNFLTSLQVKTRVFLFAWTNSSTYTQGWCEAGGWMNLGPSHWSWKGCLKPSKIYTRQHNTANYQFSVKAHLLATCKNLPTCTFASCTDSDQGLTEWVSAASRLPSHRPSRIMAKIKACFLCCSPEMICELNFRGL